MERCSIQGYAHWVEVTMPAAQPDTAPSSELSEAIELSETLERECLTDLCQGAPAELRASLGWSTSSFGSAFAVSCSRRTSELMVNRVMGTASAHDPTEWLNDALTLMRRQKAEVGGRWLLHPPPLVSSPAFERRLVELGFTPFRRRWAKFVRGRQPVRRVEAPFTLQVADEATVGELAHCLVSHLGLPIEMAGAYRTALRRPAWHLMVALDQGRVVASGALFVHDSVAYLAGAGTDVEYRKRGAQAALMAARLQVALELDCRWIVAETGEAVAGEPNHSFNNMLKHGFEVVCSRANFIATTDDSTASHGVGPRPR